MGGRQISDDVLSALGLSIVSGEYPAGTRFLLGDIEERFGVSRTVARDVVKVLEALGLLTSRRRAGLEVQPMSNWRVLDPTIIGWRLDSVGRAEQIASLTEVRTAIEPRAAKLAAQHRTDEQADTLIELAGEMRRLGSQGLGRSQAYLEADIAFHSLILQAGGNEMYAAMDVMIVAVLRGRSVHGLTPIWPDPSAMHGHLRTAQAIKDREPGRARRYSQRMIEVILGELDHEPVPDPIPGW